MGKRKDVRKVEWGRQLRTLTNNRLSYPSPADGDEGDIQARQTNVGPRLFAKLGGRWHSISLQQTEATAADVYTPKAWVNVGRTPSSATLSVHVPDFITDINVLAISFIITDTTVAQYRCFSWGADASSWDGTWDGAFTAGESGADATEIRYDRTSKKISMTGLGSDSQDKDFRLTIFFR